MEYLYSRAQCTQEKGMRKPSRYNEYPHVMAFKRGAVWWCTAVIWLLKRLTREDLELKISLGNTVRPHNNKPKKQGTRLSAHLA